jgi:hypothetical protein
MAIHAICTNLKKQIIHNQLILKHLIRTQMLAQSLH